MKGDEPAARGKLRRADIAPDHKETIVPTYALQDWIGPHIDPSVSSLVQGEASWLCVTPLRDAVFYIEFLKQRFSEAANSFAILLETAPAKDDVLFRPWGRSSEPTTVLEWPRVVVRIHVSIGPDTGGPGPER